MLNLFEKKIYKDESGHYYACFGESWEHRPKEKDQEVKFYDVPHGSIIKCSYKDLFFDDSSLLLCNNIPIIDETLFDNIVNGDLYLYYKDGELVTADDDYDEEIVDDIFQYFLLDDQTAQFLMEHTNELIFYSEALDLYVLGVTHWGTGWSVVPAEYIA